MDDDRIKRGKKRTQSGLPCERCGAAGVGLPFSDICGISRSDSAQIEEKETQTKSKRRPWSFVLSVAGCALFYQPRPSDPVVQPTHPAIPSQHLTIRPSTHPAIRHIPVMAIPLQTHLVSVSFPLLFLFFWAFWLRFFGLGVGLGREIFVLVFCLRLRFLGQVIELFFRGFKVGMPSWRDVFVLLSKEMKINKEISYSIYVYHEILYFE